MMKTNLVYKPRNKLISLRINDEVLKYLDSLCNSNYYTRSEIITLLIENYLDNFIDIPHYLLD